MHVVASGKGRSQGLVVGDLGEETKLGLAEVGVNEHAVLLGRPHKWLQQRSEVLCVGIAAGEAPGVGADNLEILRAHAAVVVEMLEDRLAVGAQDLGQ